MSKCGSRLSNLFGGSLGLGALLLQLFMQYTVLQSLPPYLNKRVR